MLKTLALLLCLLFVNRITVVSADWSPTMSFRYNGMNFMCYLLRDSVYGGCTSNSNPGPAPVAQTQAVSNPPPADPVPPPPSAPPADPAPPTPPANPTPSAAAQEKQTPGPSTPPSSNYPTPSGDDNAPAELNSDTWNANIVAAHNDFRSGMQDTPPLKWDSSLAPGAISYAQKLAGSSCTLQHSGGDYGENLFQGWGDGCKKAKSVVGYMFAECSQYQWGNPSFSMATGHFSQIVWKKTTGVGAGAAPGSNGCCIVVLRYSPAGNVQGQFGDNVGGYKGGDSSVCKPESTYLKKMAKVL